MYQVSPDLASAALNAIKKWPGNCSRPTDAGADEKMSF
jgi:hypothetical protein